MKSFVKRIWRHRWFRVCAWLAVALFATLILLRQYVDWSGARRWVAVQEMLTRKGESLDPQKSAPDPVPDEKNFCAIPPLKDLAIIPANDDDKSEQGLKRMRLLNAALPNGSKEAQKDWKGVKSLDEMLRRAIKEVSSKGYVPMPKLSQGATFGKVIDLKAWADWLRQQGWLPATPDSDNPAAEVLSSLSRDDALVSELALGLTRPESQWTPAWKTRVMPKLLFAMSLTHYSAVQGTAIMLGLRSAAAARAGDAAKAQESLLIAVRIDQAFMKEPFIIGTLVACGMSSAISGAVWELCDAHSGTAEDFRALQEALSRLDFQKSYLNAERGELAGAANAGEYLKRTRDISGLSLDPPSTKGDIPLALRLIPDGCFDANTAFLVQWHFDYYIKPLRDTGFKQLLAKQQELQILITEHKSHIFRHLDETLALIAMDAMWHVSYKVVYTQCLVNEAIAACALERYRIEHNTYPDTLEAANRAGETPIPPDVISGKPMGYRKTADGRYALWCVGFDGKDDGGKRVLDKDNPERTKFSDPKYSGDWVWDFPAEGH